jgi:hypothetical protein
MSSGYSDVVKTGTGEYNVKGEAWIIPPRYDLQVCDWLFCLAITLPLCLDFLYDAALLFARREWAAVRMDACARR